MIELTEKLWRYSGDFGCESVDIAKGVALALLL